jgi:hypothetical protein
MLSSSPPTPSSWGVVVLTDPADSVTNQFVVSGSGQYTIGIFGITAKGNDTYPYQNLGHFKVFIDDTSVSNEPGQISDCTPQADNIYCEFYVRAHLEEGIHTITVEALAKNVTVDKFRVFREIIPANLYSVKITEYNIVPVPDQQPIVLNISMKQIANKPSSWRLHLPNFEVILLLLLITLIGLIWAIAKLRLRIKEKNIKMNLTRDKIERTTRNTSLQ